MRKSNILFSISFGFVFLLAISTSSVYAAPKNSGAIWTTEIDCSEIKQNVNHYAVGDSVYINGAGFNPGTYEWTIIGKPGGASSDPNLVVASGEVIVDSSGAFCFNAYTVAQDDSGEYGAHVGVKSDNYRVRGINEIENITCEEALEQGLLTGYIDGNTAYVTNNANETFVVSLVSYEMYSGNVFDQFPFDWQGNGVSSNEQETFEVDVPECSYQIDLVCGEPILDAPWYDNRVIAFEFENEEELCNPQDSSSNSSVLATISIEDGFPQNSSFVFVCDAQGFIPKSYSWYYGDGQTLVNTTLNSVYHTYEENGTYIAACRAENEISWAVDAMEITIS